MITDTDAHQINCCRCGTVQSPRETMARRIPAAELATFHFQYAADKHWLTSADHPNYIEHVAEEAKQSLIATMGKERDRIRAERVSDQEKDNTSDQ